MNKRDLKKLSKSELIELFLKHEALDNTIVPPPELIKSTSKQEKPNTVVNRKPNKVYNHGDLLNDDPLQDFTVTNDPFERTMNKIRKLNKRTKAVGDAITDRYDTLMKTNEDVIVYPKMNVSLNKFRKEEAKLTKSMRKEGSLFLKLFEKRLGGIEGPRETISITLFVEIREGLLVVEKNIWTV